VLIAVTCPSVDVVTESIAVNVPPNPGDAVLVLFVLVTAAWLIVTELFPDWFAVKLPPPDITVPAVTVKVPLPISLVNAIVPVASGRVTVLSPVNFPANKVSSIPSTALPSNITPI
jgi:hypothetical protein